MSSSVEARCDLMGKHRRLSEAQVGVSYLVKKVCASPEVRAMLMTYGLVPGSLIRISRAKASGRGLLIENLSSGRVIALSRELTDEVLVEEFEGHVSDRERI